jgi:nitrogen regulatory protein P-II 1
MYVVLFVLNNPDLLNDVLDAWEEAGVSGATVLPSTGLGRIRQKEGLRDDLPLMPGLEDFYHHEAEISHTLFTIVDSEKLAKKVVEATRGAVGDLDQPGNGILVVLPAVSVHGLIPYKKGAHKKPG